MIEVKIKKEDLLSERPFSVFQDDILFFDNDKVYVYKNFKLEELNLENEVIIKIPNTITELMELLKIKEFFYLDLISRNRNLNKNKLKITEKEIKNFKKAYKELQ